MSSETNAIDLPSSEEEKMEESEAPTEEPLALKEEATEQ